jgi:Xaa-Pro aminopeptidase
VGDPRGTRQATVAAGLAADDLDALLVTSLPNVRYLCGFSGSNGLLLLRVHDEPLLLTDFRYAAQVAEEVGEAARVRIADRSVWTTLAGELERDPSCRVVGFEPDHVTWTDAQRLEALAITVAWRPTGGRVERLRECKDDGEVVCIREAAGKAERALATTLAAVRPGMTELAIAGMLERALREEGSEAFPFSTIVASGPRTALPHARASDRAVGRGEFLLIDFGAVHEGYCADLTRTVVVGPATEEMREVHAVVRTANERAVAGVRAGMAAVEADALARDYIGGCGYGAGFGHGLGHGLGLEVHEAPRLSWTSDGVLPAGAVFTIEPGVYRPGWGGVRVEDDVHLSNSGAALLTHFTRDLLELI